MDGVGVGGAGGVLQELKEVEQRRGMDGGREGEERGGESPHAQETTRERGGVRGGRREPLAASPSSSCLRTI